MSNLQEDYILRMIQMIGEVITAALQLNAKGQASEADQNLANVLHTIMPEHADLVEMVDESTALTLLGDSKLVEAYVELLLVQAEMKIALDKYRDGEAFQTRAIRLMIKCIQKEGYVSLKGQLIWGRLSEIDLHLLQEKTEIELWADLDRAIKNGLITVP
ncbi:MAG: hypothetical protein ISR87_06060 [Candidatus Marinimicrobia bacterium]|nr:hypothetical protein [Candidatus Neomarinimicrobiota bacterium]